jgi:twitching motility protein PilT
MLNEINSPNGVTAPVASNGSHVQQTAQPTITNQTAAQKQNAQTQNTVLSAPAPAVPPQLQSFYNVLNAMLKRGDKVSDLIFSPGRAPQVELSGDLEEVPIQGLMPLTSHHTKLFADLILNGHEQSIKTLETTGSADVSFSLPGNCRFRVNIFKQRNTHAIVMRVIPTTPPNWKDLNLPPAVCNVSELKNGLVLVTGPTGSGKSTTLAAIINLINTTKKYHIVTIEDPIEFLHQHQKSTVHQRELHSDTPNFALALRAALRQAPKVILVGEMRDRETIEVAMEAAETGHLVLSTLHTIDAAKTVDRIIGVFPKNEEPVIRTRLAQSFRRIISQRLIPKIEGGRAAAMEILVSTSRTRDYIERGEVEGKPCLMQCRTVLTKECKPSTANWRE